jgi:acetylornithine/N-succinyldiaminopimelate aminotransferase
VMPTYGRLPVALSHGQGAEVWDTEGRRYLDALSGIAVNTLGHNHSKLVPALQDQVSKMIHCCNYYQVPLQEELARLLVERSGLTNVFFCNSGLEANEAALKIARKFGHDKGIDRAEVVVSKRPSMAAPSPRCRPRATPRCTPVSSRWSRASCACRSTTSRHWRKWLAPTRT